MTNISPLDPAYLGKPVWCIYGPDCFPTMICCKVLTSVLMPGYFIWGYSVYRRSPGFRTLGMGIDAFTKRYENAKFYATQEDALGEIAKLTKPRRESITPDPR